ncbi:roadblock/LC7 domain-containing protein [Moraxella atlantae]|uniref:roadblock/LC7 domain-containing protein n=1 Tax=Faucicola atlantae TaxID=34059 RepID=UPI0009F62E9B|nr:roadblock/LC7 domain-containing protein [Moraxella atlantae]
MSDNIFNMENRVKPNERFLSLAKDALQDLLVSTNGLDGVLLASTDGFEVISLFQQNYDGGKLSAVGSSILALVQALVTEAHLIGCRSVILDAENGKIMISAVPNANQPMIVILLTKQQVLLGQLMHGLNKTVKQLVELDAQYNTKA